jgi:hypothetical protein
MPANIVAPMDRAACVRLIVSMCHLSGKVRRLIAPSPVAWLTKR